MVNYTIPRNNRELQPLEHACFHIDHYTIPRNNRELQHKTAAFALLLIIPYQEIIGNYSIVHGIRLPDVIIPYQEIIGNYSFIGTEMC